MDIAFQIVLPWMQTCQRLTHPSSSAWLLSSVPRITDSYIAAPIFVRIMCPKVLDPFTQACRPFGGSSDSSGYSRTQDQHPWKLLLIFLTIMKTQTQNKLSVVHNLCHPSANGAVARASSLLPRFRCLHPANACTLSRLPRCPARSTPLSELNCERLTTLCKPGSSSRSRSAPPFIPKRGSYPKAPAIPTGARAFLRGPLFLS
ncbi:hypothetical protein BDV96DRAFT_580265 [Lophiotrema nucula]|uniref:Uncharacterized protein n=1 Tax=Lophiotrema nucula TaxID=690887 RepID=A0A6A5YZY2_9PLEO|nr:hypothetical protein BDV96DRAFT_580265 [Lophiotrema nucula]